MASEPTATAMFATRVWTIQEQIVELRNDIKEILIEAKEAGCLKLAVRRTAKLMRETEDQRLERETVELESDQAFASLGLLDGKPLRDAKQADLDFDPAPPIPTPYELGRKAGQDGRDADDNDFPAGSDQAAAWIAGWVHRSTEATSDDLGGDPKEEGAEAFWVGLGSASNPYESESVAARQWDAGWQEQGAFHAAIQPLPPKRGRGRPRKNGEQPTA
jgi:uncharacterized protein (UPF0335 family)